MAAEEAAVVLRGAELFNGADVDGMMQLWHPDAVSLDHRPIGWEPMGRDQVRELNLSAFAVVPDVQRQTTLLDCPSQAVVARVRFFGHAADGGGEVELEYTEVTWVRHGLIVRRDIYAGPDEARASLDA